jgi:hypothetical protein
MSDLPDQHRDISKTITAPAPSHAHPHDGGEARAAEAKDFAGPQDVPATSGQNPGWALGKDRNRPEPTEAVNRSNVGKQVGKRASGVKEVADVVAKALRDLRWPA